MMTPEMTDHVHQFPEEETPEGVRLLLPCLFCALPAADAMKLAEQENADLEAAIVRVRGLVDTQAEDSGLWFRAETAPEAYLQQELRRLHALVEACLVEEEPNDSR